MTRDVPVSNTQKKSVFFNFQDFNSSPFGNSFRLLEKVLKGGERMNFARAAVSLERCRTFFIDANRNRECCGINEINQVMSAMVDFMCNPTNKSSDNLDERVKRFKKFVSGEG